MTENKSAYHYSACRLKMNLRLSNKRWGQTKASGANSPYVISDPIGKRLCKLLVLSIDGRSGIFGCGRRLLRNIDVCIESERGKGTMPAIFWLLEGTVLRSDLCWVSFPTGRINMCVNHRAIHENTERSNGSQRTRNRILRRSVIINRRGSTLFMR